MAFDADRAYKFHFQYSPIESWSSAKSLCGYYSHTNGGHPSDQSRRGSRIFCRGGGQRRPCTAGAFGARADGGSRVDKHQIKVHSVHRIFRAIVFFFFFAIVKKFVEKKNWWSRAGGGSRPPPWIRPCSPTS